MGDTIYRYPVALRWDQGSKELKKVKNKILKYFQARSESNGGECEIRDTNCSWGYILIHFKDKEAQQRVLQKKTHRVPLLVGVISVDASLPAPGDAQSTGRVFSSLVSSDDDEASGSSSDTGHQHENNHNLHNLKRKVSKRPGDDSTEDDSTEDDSTEDDSTEDDSTEDDSTEDDSTESKEWISVDRKKHNVTSSAPKSLTEHYEHGRHQYSGTPRNESRSNSVRLHLSKEGAGDMNGALSVLTFHSKSIEVVLAVQLLHVQGNKGKTLTSSSSAASMETGQPSNGEPLIWDRIYRMGGAGYTGQEMGDLPENGTMEPLDPRLVKVIYIIPITPHIIMLLYLERLADQLAVPFAGPF
ncbi:uncharacterized protein LOC143925192 [Lithobates pipiens]